MPFRIFRSPAGGAIARHLIASVNSLFHFTMSPPTVRVTELNGHLTVQRGDENESWPRWKDCVVMLLS